MKQFSSREKRLVFITVLSLALFLCWQYGFNPLLASIRQTETKIKSTKLQIQQLKGSSALPLDKSMLVKKEELKIYAKEEQLNRILQFVDKKFRWYGIELLSLGHTTKEKELFFDLKFKSSSYQLLGFLNSLSQLKTVLIIDKVTIDQADEKLIVQMKLISAFKGGK